MRTSYISWARDVTRAHELLTRGHELLTRAHDLQEFFLMSPPGFRKHQLVAVGDKICACPWKRVRVQISVPVRGPVSVSVHMPVIVFVERLRVCIRGHVSVTVSVYVSVDAS